jgi:hypothetical protein
MNEFWKDYLHSLVRKGVTAIAAFLLAHGLLTAEQSTPFVVELSAAIVTGAISLWMSYKDTIKNRALKLVALDAQPGTTEAQVNQTVSAMPSELKTAIAKEPTS